MRGRRVEHSATLRTAETALEEIAARGQAADPRSYALWYNYAAGDSGLLTAAVNNKLARDGKLTAREVEDLYTAHISPAGVSEKADRTGERVGGELEQIMAMIMTAAGSASVYSASLADGARRLDEATDVDGVRAVVADLSIATSKMELANVKLQDQLHAAMEEISRLRREIGALRTESQTDSLTSLGDRKFFDSAIGKAVADAHAADEPLSLLLVDVDHFKKINDTYGHVVGDKVLRFVARNLKDSLKGKDISARCGADVFAVILPRTTLDAALGVGDQLRQAVTKAELVRRSTGEKRSSLTVSVGVATLAPAASAQSLVETAAVCLHAAKRSGRNCVVGENDERLLDAVAQ